MSIQCVNVFPRAGFSFFIERKDLESKGVLLVATTSSSFSSLSVAVLVPAPAAAVDGEYLGEDDDGSGSSSRDCGGCLKDEDGSEPSHNVSFITFHQSRFMLFLLLLLLLWTQTR